MDVRKKIKVWACGFDDQLPCARNNYNLGIGATIFTHEDEARQFVDNKVIECRELVVYSDIQLTNLIARQRNVLAMHVTSLGFGKEAIDAEMALFDHRTRKCKVKAQPKRRRHAYSLKAAEKIKADVVARNKDLVVDIYCITPKMYKVEWFE